MSDELLELLWVLEATLDMEPDLEAQLEKVVAGPCFTATELPQPAGSERMAPGASVHSAGGLLGLMGVDLEEEEHGDAED